jgi:peptidoglycan/LPS O-acetylase OafA/YrhL
MNAPITSPHARVPALDGVRGLAIVLVVVMHSLFFGVPLPGVPPLSQEHPFVRLVGLGWCGVDVFFVLSGYLITGILVQSRGQPHWFRNFYARRALRIFPLYYLVLALLLWVLPRPPVTGAETAAYLLYYQNFHFAFGGDRHPDLARDITWSLAIEEQFYLVWPAVVAWLTPRWLPRVCVLAIVGAIVLRFVGLELGIPKPYFLTFCRVDALAAGALLALLPLPPRWFGALALLAGGAGLVGIAFATGNSLPAVPVMQTWGLIAALAFAVGISVLARHDGVIARLFSLRPLRSFGAYSYCIYLVHFLVIETLALRCYGDPASPPNAVQRWLVANLSEPWLLLGFAGLCLLASWVIGWLSWHLFEQRLLRWKRHFPSVSDRSAP